MMCHPELVSGSMLMLKRVQHDWGIFHVWLRESEIIVNCTIGKRDCKEKIVGSSPTMT